MTRLPLFVFSLGLLVLIGCRKTPDNVLPHDEMVSLLADLHRGEGVMDMNRREFKEDSMRIAFRDAIYRKHNVTKQTVDSSYYWYARNMDEYSKIYDDVIALLEKEIEETEATAARIQTAAVGDSANAWSFSSRYILSENSPQHELAVQLFPDDNWEKGDNYTLNFKLINNLSPFTSMIGVEYADGQLEWIENESKDAGKYNYTLVTDSTKELSRVFSVLRAPQLGSQVVFVDSLSLMRTRKDKSVYSKRHSQKKILPVKEIKSLRVSEPSDTINENDN